jgi:hypothetical protein
MRAAIEAWRRGAFERVSSVQDFVRVLMKPRNGEAWTEEDRRFLTAGFRSLGRMTPIFLLFLLPGGFALAGAYAWLIDRRRQRRRAQESGVSERPLT